MKVLELFSGTGSIGKVAKAMGYSVISLDLLMPADIQEDIMHWDYQQWPPGSFDYIHASPPCAEFSRAKTTGVRKLDEANAIVKRTLEIIKYFKPLYWTMENPQTGLLKDQEYMNKYAFVDTDYCRYGLPYRKRTRIWCNMPHLLNLPLCNRDCGSMDGKRHIQTAQRMPQGKKETWGDKQCFSQGQLYVIPEGLVKQILEALSKDWLSQHC